MNKYSGSLFHLSTSNLDGKTLKLRIPSNYLIDNGFEDDKTKRVCFSTTIDGCLSAMSSNIKDKEFYVHVPDEEVSMKTPSIEEVPDVKITHERWILTDVKLKCIGKIKVGEAKEKGLTYTYGKNTATLYEWNYKWVDKYMKESEEFSTKLKKDVTMMEQAQYSTLYHGSHNDIKGNTINIANKSYEDKDYVFATYDILFALCFAGNPWYDGIFNLSYYNGELTLIEKQSGALKKTFDTDGYIYIISDSDISKFKARSKHVLISDKSVKYSKKIYIKNVLDKLKSSNIKIYNYPSKPNWFNNKFDNTNKE